MKHLIHEVHADNPVASGSPVRATQGNEATAPESESMRLLATAWAAQLNDRYFEGQLGRPALEELKNLPVDRTDVCALIERSAGLMRLGKLDPRDFSPLLARWFAVLVPRILPGAWGGMILPITFEQRHKRIDEYLAHCPRMGLCDDVTLLDVGCGFPPFTAIDTAQRFPHWHIIGADPSFDQYLLYDERGDYACFNANGQIRYFQPGAPDLARWDELHQDRDATLQRFADLFGRLQPKLPKGAGERSAIVEEGVTRLIRKPLQDFERCNLHFLQVGLGSPGVPEVDVVRCFNVLVYFDADFRRKAETWVAMILRPDGLFLCGVDGPRTLEARYVVSRKEKGGLVEKEFAFSLDNVRPLTAIPWFCLHDGERETFRLASAVGILRADDAFRGDFNERLDHLLEDKGICAREPNGYLGPLFQGLVPTERVARIEEVMEQLEQEGFVDRAAGVLRGAGLRAQCNSVGHIAIDLDESISDAF